MSAVRERQARRVVAVGVLILVAFACTAGLRPLQLPDEGRYVGVAWEMLHSGDWLTPTLDGLPFLHKPPLFYWITAAALSVFGANEWAARMAPLLGAWVGAFGMYLFVRRWRDERSAVLTALALVVQPLQFLGGQFANLDMLVAGLITATILLLAHAALGVEQRLPQRGALLAAYACAALGVLAKGLIGAVLPALVIGAWLLVRRRWRTLFALASPLGVLLFLLLAAPWFVVMQLRFDGFLDYFFVVQHFRRFAAGGFNNVQPAWFYIAVVSLFTLPWLPWLARLAWLPADGARARELRALMLVWIVVVVGFYSIPQSKLVGYVLPAVPPLGFLLADALSAVAQPTTRSRQLWGLSAALSAAAGVAVVIVLSGQWQYSSLQVARRLAGERAAGEPVFMVGRYYYDVPFYARLDGTVTVVADWSQPDVRIVDNWRKELADAADFRPSLAARRLLLPAALPAALCIEPVSWVIGNTGDVQRLPFLAEAAVAYSGRDATLWKVDRRRPGLASALACAQRPSAGSEDR